LTSNSRICGLPAAASSCLSVVISSLFTCAPPHAVQHRRRRWRAPLWGAQVRGPPGSRHTAACGSRCRWSPPRSGWCGRSRRLPARLASPGAPSQVSGPAAAPHAGQRPQGASACGGASRGPLRRSRRPLARALTPGQSPLHSLLFRFAPLSAAGAKAIRLRVAVYPMCASPLFSSSDADVCCPGNHLECTWEEGNKTRACLQAQRALIVWVEYQVASWQR